MNKQAIVDSVLANRIVAIIRGFSPDVCFHLAEAYLSGGVRLVEVTFNQKNPASWKDTAAAISGIKARFPNDLRVGAGTVLSSEQLKMCADAGGEYMITPSVNPALIRECSSMGLVAMPGAFTPTEAVAAFEAGADFVKIFPAGNLGPSYVKAITAPLSHIPFLAVGGISPDNVADFIKAGCVGAGVGGNLTNREWIERGEWSKIAAVAKSLADNSKL